MPDVLMPRLSDTMTEGVLSEWRKGEGDPVHRGDVLAEIETDKATMELEAYDDGVLERHLVAPGTTVPIGQPIAVIGDGTGTVSAPAPAQAEPAEAVPPPAAAPAPTTPAPGPAAAGPPAAVRTSPLARALAREHGIDLSTVTGTGPGGRIVRADVQSAITVAAPASQPAPAPAPAAAPIAAGDEKIPLSAVRRITARRLTESAAAPHFYLTSVVDAGRLLAFRAEINQRLAADGVKISITDLLVRACAVTLRVHPQVNASWGGDHILRRANIHIGVAVALDDGLIVPVIRDADRKSIGEIAGEAHTLADRARAGKLTPDEFTGSTFTISNLGMYGIDHFTAVINPPEAAILAVGAATDEAVVRDGQVLAATTMKLTLSIDHRVLDGATAAAFERDLVQVLEEPLRIVV
ncbi:MAG TPA: dihydrolipoamide acetyltransferase family protein [Jatrophihabitantaceae bacterium]|jgi:pyruvate dehydrogenase E2 component (dihydrolipoamide acetyltransferase)